MSAHNASAKSKSRSAARLASVQALYQMDMEDIGIARLLNEFHSHRLGQEIEDAQYADADPDFLMTLCRGLMPVAPKSMCWLMANLAKNGR